MPTPQIPLADLIAELSDPAGSVRKEAIRKIMRRRTVRGQAFQDFVRLSRDAEAPVRRAAIRALAQLGDIKALPYLTHLLNEPSYQTRLQVVKALDILGGAQVVPYLITALSDRTARIRLTALNVLVKLVGAQATPQLLLSLTDQEVAVRLQALEHLYALQGAQALPQLLIAMADQEVAVRLQALEHLYALQGAQALPQLLIAMADQTAQMRDVAIRHLVRLGRTHSQVIQDLLALTSHVDGETRVAVFRVLAQLSDPRSFDAMLSGLRDEESTVRVFAVTTLCLLADPRAIEPLLALCSDPVALVRLRVAEALGKFGDKRAVDPLLIMLNDADQSVAAYAAWALEALSDPRAIPALATCFSTAKDLRLRGTAMRALSSLVMQVPAEIARPEIFEQFLSGFGDGYVYIREDAQKVLGLPACQPLLRQPLLDMLARENASLQMRVAALKVLEISGWWSDPQVLATLLRLIEQESEYIPVRTKAIGLLAKSGDGRAIEPLLKLLTSSDLSLCWAASEALGLLGDPRALESLRALLAQTVPGHLSVLLREAIKRIALAN